MLPSNMAVRSSWVWMLMSSLLMPFNHPVPVFHRPLMSWVMKRANRRPCQAQYPKP